eukprot:TRINITY_DN3313_c0_g6_i1.p2 TRINITY_DN3313_c0_g6~~TRINITY_DN3313_c0_g6_i1.p2  ORF type:complete len:113 (-),score=13.03 TRINITY_DN3313_c0_g6_i1:325-663(-)
MKPINDCTFSAAESGFSIRQFVIYYSVEQDKYFIKDLSDASGTFVKIDSQIRVKQGNVFSFGKFHIIVNYKASDDPDFTLYIHVYNDCQAKEQMYYFLQQLVNLIKMTPQSC